MFTALLASAAGPAWAGPVSPTPAASLVPGKPVCTFDDPRVVELSGLVATDSGYVAINDGNDVPAATRIFFFDRTCALVRTVGYPTTARDPEDLAVAADGTLWVADIGDNLTNGAENRRATIALWKLGTGGSTTPVIHRLTYPDGPHDAEALLLTGDGTPVIVTKELSGVAGLYTPAGPLQPNTPNGAALRKVGTFTPQRTGTPGFFGVIGQLLVTGAAQTADRRRLALRTYSDAYEWDVPDGDLVRAITTGTPRITPLPDEPQGESIAYTRDGSMFLTVSDQQGPAPLLSYAPVRPASAAGSGTAAPGGSGSPARWFSTDQARYLLAAAAALVVAMVAFTVRIIRRPRRGRSAAR